MPCYSPLLAWQQGNGDIVFVERMGKDVRRELSLPCGQCIGCRLERARAWAVRCVHEASLHKQNSFVTLTYDNDNLPNRGCLHYPDYQRFMKRLRKYFDKEGIKFYMCGEYGPLNWRPHYHACLFGVDFEDKEYCGTGESGSPAYTSELLERLWGHGGVTTGDVTFQSAGYTARYCVQKITGPNAKAHYGRTTDPVFGPSYTYQLVPEFNKMSLKPGIAAEFYKKWKGDMYPHDYMVYDGKKMSTPAYYDKLYKREEPEIYEELQWKRELEGRRHWEDNVPERLIVKETVQRAQAAFLKRNLNG